MNSTGGGRGGDEDELKTETAAEEGSLALGVKALLFCGNIVHPAHLLERQQHVTILRVSPLGHISEEPVLVGDRQGPPGEK